MAVEKSLAKRSMAINVKDGVNADGTDKLKACNSGKIKEAASVEDIFAVGTAMGGLMAKEVVEITVTEKSTLTQGM